MSEYVIEVIHRGVSASIQDFGRPGWARFGVPPGGVMDPHAAGWANRLLNNPIEYPVLELLLQGARLRMLKTSWIAITGADARCNYPTWRILRAHEDEVIHFSLCQKGVWSYVAVEGGFISATYLGSSSAYPRGGMGKLIEDGSILEHPGDQFTALPHSVAGRFVKSDALRDYLNPPRFRLWKGPQWDRFSKADRDRLFQSEWAVSAQSDRTGYRLQGEPLTSYSEQIISEPVLVGSIQVPQDGNPIVTLNDGPTIGGYPKIALIDPEDLSWLVQCRPGQSIRFQTAE